MAQSLRNMHMVTGKEKVQLTFPYIQTRFKLISGAVYGN
jgi:hypothetical protein